MTTPLWCLLIVSVIPYGLAGVSVYFKQQQFGDVDNKHPRLQSAKLEGAGARAVAAQGNAWESLAVFGTAVIIAHLVGADAGQSAIASLIYLATRIAHPILYLANQDSLRTLVFVIGLANVVWLFALSIAA